MGMQVIDPNVIFTHDISRDFIVGDLISYESTELGFGHRGGRAPDELGIHIF